MLIDVQLIQLSKWGQNAWEKEEHNVWNASSYFLGILHLYVVRFFNHRRWQGYWSQCITMIFSSSWEAITMWLWNKHIFSFIVSLGSWQNPYFKRQIKGGKKSNSQIYVKRAHILLYLTTFYGSSKLRYNIIRILVLPKISSLRFRKKKHLKKKIVERETHFQNTKWDNVEIISIWHWQCYTLKIFCISIRRGTLPGFSMREPHIGANPL